MRFLTDKIKRLDIGWNERRLTEDDFYAIARRFNVTVIETPLQIGGFYFRLMGCDVIAVDCRLTGFNKLAVMFHELGHLLFHVPATGPVVNFHDVGRRTRKEIEADIFALCAVIPRKRIENLARFEQADIEAIPADLITARFEILERYGI